MRGLLALVSLALVGLGLIICVSSRSANAWHTFFAWLITYFVGLNVYFVVRYAPWFKVKYMLQSLFKK